MNRPSLAQNITMKNAVKKCNRNYNTFKCFDIFSFNEDWISTLSITASNDINEDTLYSLAQQVYCLFNQLPSFGFCFCL